MQIEGRTAFVTGAASGIGLAIAEALLGAGARVVLADLDRDELQHQVQRLGPNAQSFLLDVTDRAAWPAARQFVEDWSGPVDILVNNAGIGPDMRPLADMAPENFDLLLRIKLQGTFNGVQTFAGGMRERRSGHIVNTASMAGLMIVQPGLGAYTTAMFGLVGMTELLRLELDPFDVGVSVLCPGLIRTRLNETTRAITGSSLETGTAGGPPSASPSAHALPPSVVGDTVVDAIRAGDLYILTHGEYGPIVDDRSRHLSEAFQRTPRRDGAES
jgi:NAD(P)-dependent dehydrogenase (short-subunit alcohol dehydrogenase family)